MSTEIGIPSGEGRENHDEDKLKGILEQVRADIAVGSHGGDAKGMLASRLRDTGVKIDDERFAALVKELEG